MTTAGSMSGRPVHGRRRATIVSSLEETNLDESAWNGMASGGETNTVFQTHEWMRSWWSVFGERHVPVFVAVADESATIAVVPLVVEKEPGRERVLRFLGDRRADYCDFVGACDDETVAAAIEVVHQDGRWDVLELNNIPMQSRTIHAVAAKCRRLGYRALVTDHFACPTLVIRGHEQEAQAILEKPSLRRRIRRFNRTGHLTYRDLRTLEDIDPYLDRFFAQHIARWREHEEPSLFVDPLNQEFYRALTRNLDAKGLLFSVVEYEGDAIAFHFGFDFDGVVTWYKPSFDVAHAQWSPGLVLVRHLLEHAIAQGRRELDFTIGDEAFKRRFTNVTRKTVRIQVFRDPGRYALERSRRGLVAAIKRASSAIGKGIVA